MTTGITKRVGQAHKQEWLDAIEGMIGLIYTINVTNGWFDADRSYSDDIALLHSEVSEAYEAVRTGNFTSGKDSFQDECADIFIRLLDTCYRRDINLIQQVLAKLEINESRGYRHGGKIV